MLKYNQYIRESADEEKKFKFGETVIFTPGPNQSYYDKFKGQKCKVGHYYGNDEYQIFTPTGSAITVNAKTLRSENDPQSPTGEYIEKQFQNPKASLIEDEKSINVIKDDFFPGQRVIVNGTEGRITFIDRKGTVNRVTPESCFVELDGNDSKNERGFSMMIDKSIIKPIDEPSRIILKIGDTVLCTDKSSSFFDRSGEVTRVWPDGEGMIQFTETNGTKMNVVMKPEQVKITGHSKPKEFVDKKDNVILTSTTDNVIEEEDDDDTGVVITRTGSNTFKKEDLLEFSYKDFFLEEKISTKEEIVKNKERYQSIIDNKELPEFKSAFYERSLRTAEIIEQYFDFLIAKVAKNLPVYRTVEQIDNKDLLVTKTKVRASESKEITKKYSFDQGIIAYWIFKDAVVFKTI